METSSLLMTLTAFGLVVVAAIIDQKTGRIPNALTLGGVVIGILASFFWFGFAGLLHSIFGALATALVPLLLFRAKAMGGGDVKLFCALGALLGLQQGLEIESAAFLAGAVQGTILWLRQGRLKNGFCAVVGMVVPFLGRRLRNRPDVAEAATATIRFGPAIAVGTVISITLNIVG